jgi:hypothetical protein
MFSLATLGIGSGTVWVGVNVWRNVGPRVESSALEGDAQKSTHALRGDCQWRRVYDHCSLKRKNKCSSVIDRGSFFRLCT